jgi:phosphoserine phosphatase
MSCVALGRTPGTRESRARTTNAFSCIPSRLVQMRARCPHKPAAVQREPTSDTMDVLSRLDGICFDVDSTFCQDESIDELAEFLGCGDVVRELTAKAMGGNVLFQDALKARLDAMGPSRADVERFLVEHPHVLSDGIQELLNVLAARGVKVFLVSGGFRQIIEPLAEQLGIPKAHVFANNLLFEREGGYAGFDPEEFTSRSGGKREAVRHIRKAFGMERVAMIGDGATDAEARGDDGAELFIGYGGTVFREGVAERADWYVMKIDEITSVLRRL